MTAKLLHTAAMTAVLVTTLVAPASAQSGGPAITATWYSTADSAQAFPTGVQRIGTGNTGSLRIDFDVTPAAAPINGVVGYADSSVPVTEYLDFGVAVRLATSGYFDARDGAAYTRRADLAYAAGRTYHVRITVDVPGRSYSVDVTPPGGSPVRIAEGYTFRFDSPDTDDVGQVGIKSDVANQFRVDNHTVTALNHHDGIPPAKRTTSVSLSGLASAVANAQPGDHIIVRNGSYSTGGRIYLRGRGTFDNPVVVTAETVGGVTVTGSSGFTIEDSSYLVVRGFVFRHGQGDGRGMETASSDHVRISRNHFALTNVHGGTKWLRLRGGSKARIDHNRFENKTTTESMVLVDPGSDGVIAKHTLVDHNYLAGTRSPDSDTNEALRIGVSDVQAQSAYAVVQYNLFYDNRGDAEVISNKTTDNLYRHNTFRGNHGSLVVRHGDRVTVEGNYFLADNGGVRMYGDGNAIVGNYFEGNTGSGVESTLIIGAGSVSADEPYAGAGYDQPNGGVVAFNALVNNGYHLRIGYGSGSLAPRNMRIGNNILRGTSGELVLYDRSPSGFSWEGNILYGTSRGDIPSGYRVVDPQLVEGSDSVYRLSSGSPGRDAAASSASYPLINTDLDGHPRIEVKDTGADEYSTAAPLRRPLSSGDVGPGAAGTAQPVAQPAAQLVTAGPVSVAAAVDLPVSGVVASHDDGQNFASNTRDNDLSTRWSGFGDGVWIRYDLGQPVSVHYLRVAWYHGNERVSAFDVQTSADATSWTTRWTGRSSGTTTGFEAVDFADVTARYVRIVGHGNTVNGWTSITELDVFGEAPGGYDVNGVKQIYRTATGGAAPWVLGYPDVNGVGWWDRAVRLPGKWLDDDNVDLTINGSGRNTVVTAGGSQIRLYVAATPFDPNAHCDGDNDLSDALARGYMCSSRDWRNYEITGYFQLVTPSAGDSRSWQMYGGGGRHSDTTEHRCKGTAYKARLHYQEGWVQLRKEGPHPYYHNRTFSGRKAPDYTLSENRSRWLGMKLVRYELTRDGRRIVRLEMYLDTTGVDGSGNPSNAWQLVAATEDTGGWGDDLDLCGVAADQIMLWGGPWIGYRWDDTTSRIRLMTTREIQPGQKW